MNEHVVVKLGLEKTQYDAALKDAKKRAASLQERMTNIGNIARGFGAVILLRQLGKELMSIRDIVQETPEMFTQDTVDRVEALQVSLERSVETYKQLKVLGVQFLDWQRLPSARKGATGEQSQKTQLEQVARMEDKLKVTTERRKKVDAELAKIAAAKERADRRIRDLVLEQLEPAEQLAMLQREQAEAAADVMKHAEGTKEFFESQEKLADKAMQVFKKMEEIEKDRISDEQAQLSLLKQQEEVAIRLRNIQQSITDAKLSEQQALGDRSKLSIDQAANMPVMNRYAAEVAWLSKKAIALEEQAGLYRAHGYGKKGEEMANEALAIRQRLEPVLRSSDANPMSAVQKAVESSAEAMQALLDQAQTRGIVVQPRNGP